MGAKRQELPMSGNSFGPGMSAYDLACCGVLDIGPSSAILLSVFVKPGSSDVATSFGNILIADEKAVRLTSELAAARVPIFCLLLYINYNVRS